MDQERQIRFLYPPIIVISFFLWRFLWDQQGMCLFGQVIDALKPLQGISGSVTLLLTGGTLILVCGFLLGTLTFTLMRISFMIVGWSLSSSHEFPFHESARKEIWDFVFWPKNPGVLYDPNLNLMASAWIDRNRSGKGITEWITRRWNAFNVCANIGVGILLVMLWFHIYHANSRSIPSCWTTIGWSLVGLCAFNGCIARHETMQMLKFIALNPSQKTGD